MASVMWWLAAVVCLGVCWASWVWRLALAHRGARVLAACALTGLAFAVGSGPWLVAAGCCLVFAEFARAWQWPMDFEVWAVASGLSRAFVGVAAVSQGWSLGWAAAGVGLAVGWWWSMARPIQEAASEQGGAREMMSMVAVQVGTAICVGCATASASLVWVLAGLLMMISDTVDGRDRFVGVVPSGELVSLILVHAALVVAVCA